MRSEICKFLGPIYSLLLALTVIEFNGILAAADNVKVREMKVEHRLDDFESLTETRDHDHEQFEHNSGFFPLKSHNKPKNPKASYGSPKPQYGVPTKSQYLPPKVNYESSSYSKPSPAYHPTTYRPPIYSPPNYNNPAAFFPILYSEKVPAYQPSAYSSPDYSKPSYPLSSGPEYPYKIIPETNKEVNKEVFNNNGFPTFDDFFKKSIQFHQFKI